MVYLTPFFSLFFRFQLWANYEEPKNIVVVEETERKCNYKKVCFTLNVYLNNRHGVALNFCCSSSYFHSVSCLQVIVTETKQGLSFWAQHVDSGKQTDFL